MSLEKKNSTPIGQQNIPENTDLKFPQISLEREMKNLLSLRAADRQEAEDKFQVALMQATAEKMGRDLTAFMSATENELKKMNENQMKLLSVQEQYKKEIATEVGKILNAMYNIIAKNQKTVFDEILSTANKSVSALEKRIHACTAECKKQTDNISARIKDMRTIECWQDILKFIAPLAVIADLIFRALAYFNVM